MRTWIKLASLALVAGVAGGVRAQDRPRNDDRPRTDPPPRAADDRTRDQDRTRSTEERQRTTEERTRTTETRTDDRTRHDDKALTDSHFIDHAYTMGENEVLLARLALQRSQNEEVRRFAQKMIEDHGKCGSSLIMLVSEQRIAIPDKPLPEQEADLKRIFDPSLQDFDRAYIEQAVKDHEKAVRLFERASKELKTEQIKAYAEKQLTTLREHEKLAKDTQAKVNGGARTETGATHSESGTRTRTETDTHRTESGARTETQSGTRTRTESGTRTRGDDDGKGLTDNEFVMKVAASGKAEVAIGKIGQEKGKNADVKRFADRVVKDHTKANEELMAAAKDAGISVSEKPADQDEHVKQFRDASEKNFDKEFADHMVQSHTKGVELFTKASKELKNEKLRSFAEKTLPTLKEHLQIAKDLQAKFGRE